LLDVLSEIWRLNVFHRETMRPINIAVEMGSIAIIFILVYLILVTLTFIY